MASAINGSFSGPILAMEGICKAFGPTKALERADFAVSAGEVHALVGENGAGKTTLMKIVSGAEKPDAGIMKLGGEPYLPRSPLEARLRGVGMIYQELSLAPHLTVEENISLGMEISWGGIVGRKSCRQRAAEALARLGHPEIPLDALVRHLGISFRQIVEIARAVASGCRVLVLDEPTSSLGKEDVDRLFRLVRALKQSGHAIVYISHSLEEVKKVADRITILRDGKVVMTAGAADLSLDRIIESMIGTRVEQLYPRSSRTPGEPILELKNVAGYIKPLGASLVLRRGEVVGIAGLVGSGRTELARLIFGLEKVRRGEIRVGAFLGPGSPCQRWAQGMGLVSEDRAGEGIAVRLDVASNITLSRMEGLGPFGLILPKREAQVVSTWIKKLGIRCRGPQQRVGRLSGGNQQKVALARLLHHDVDIFLLDEPTRGIDVASKAQIYRLIDELASGGPASAGKPRAILMVSSYFPELLGICDRIAVMTKGVLGEARPVSEWDEHKLLKMASGRDAA